ncbi:hypothetical protein RHMOL_Rhmol09G0092700 [Rhododendron molle]|uniref:Uncharacterized protein n=1 Tax=Rhododendron molle TaxID=49168 RepID=A0ACC0MD47_RHOML|nr:hypothetical protein RHMOL_Rhmol09G0092700 [Rhododendron molle]
MKNSSITSGWVWPRGLEVRASVVPVLDRSCKLMREREKKITLEKWRVLNRSESTDLGFLNQLFDASETADGDGKPVRRKE